MVLILYVYWQVTSNQSIINIQLIIIYKGVATKEELLSDDNKVKSTYYIDSFGDFGKN